MRGGMRLFQYSAAIDAKLEALKSIRKHADDEVRQGMEPGALAQFVLAADTYFWDDAIAKVVASSAELLPPESTVSGALFPRDCWFYFPEPMQFPDPEFEAGGVRSSPTRAVLFGIRRSLLYVQRWRDWMGGLDVADQSRYNLEIPLGDALRAPEGIGGAGAARFILAASLWVNQSVVVLREQPIERHARKRFMRASAVPAEAIKVVTLRRAETAASGSQINPADGAIEWSCQWIVRGHWRQQFYPSTGEHRPKWILPHVKGPEDRPLKSPTTTIFAVTR